MQAKLLVALKTAAAAALGAVLPMLPDLMAHRPELAPLISAIVTAVVLHLTPHAKAPAL
jgi:VIT1/CCC1 family predicted Fe2+/Mn2+ transporter